MIGSFGLTAPSGEEDDLPKNVTPATETSDPLTLRRWREFLGEQVRDLARRNLLTAQMIEEARQTDQALIVDLDGPRFTISTMPRQHLASFVPADRADEMLLQMVQGQPALEPAEATAAWCFVSDLGHPGSISTHMRVRALRITGRGRA
jgi:hypothetical protein